MLVGSSPVSINFFGFTFYNKGDKKRDIKIVPPALGKLWEGAPDRKHGILDFCSAIARIGVIEGFTINDLGAYCLASMSKDAKAHFAQWKTLTGSSENLFDLNLYFWEMFENSNEKLRILSDSAYFQNEDETILSFYSRFLKQIRKTKLLCSQQQMNAKDLQEYFLYCLTPELKAAAYHLRILDYPLPEMVKALIEKYLGHVK